MDAAKLFFPLARLQDQHVKSKYPNRRVDSKCLSWNEVSHRYSPWEQKIIFLMLNNKYTDAVMYINSESSIKVSKYYQRLKMLLRIYLLNSEYNAVLDFESRLSSYQFNSLDMDERMNLIECKSLLLLNWFLRGEFYLCLQKFIQFLVEIPSFIELLKASLKDGIFITDTNICHVVAISALITIPLDNLNNFIYLPELEKYNQNFSTLAIKSKLLIDSKFGQFFEWWHNEMAAISRSDYFLDKKWDVAARTMRQKIYSFYLRISVNITVSYLSEKFNIDYQVVRQEILELINEACLNFEIKGDLISYREFDAREALKDRIVLENSIICSKLSFLGLQNKKLSDFVKTRVSELNAKSTPGVSAQIPINMEELFFNSDEEITDESN